jgi:hypothetical protein
MPQCDQFCEAFENDTTWGGQTDDHDAAAWISNDKDGTHSINSALSVAGVSSAARIQVSGSWCKRRGFFPYLFLLGTECCARKFAKVAEVLFLAENDTKLNPTRRLSLPPTLCPFSCTCCQQGKETTL